MSRIKFAVLDDYQNLATRHFAHLNSRVDISYFPDTLDPRDPAQQKQQIACLRPFDAILAMGERTPMARDTDAKPQSDC
ncbi:hypothetical protein CNMCM8927_008602 [Aspergillus lentulus]|uniref:Uncharacterized protein n=1 Tax=Aspergillus lentulus TaxID=293939 RepID=A0AAN5YL02_ASPLE|nr:hypothetical protein CNMCM6069_007843 [Aspergillus lentulus]KAF4203555.1 hypothetical protein CNMCM8927_008602 [Aspergillus lentulus]